MKPVSTLNVNVVDSSWQPAFHEALAKLPPSYYAGLLQSLTWLPGHDKIFNAFALPLHQVNYLLLGESPYPRASSANGYAFWDAAVDNIWCATGLSKPVNRATSLRNLIKMLLVADGLLAEDGTTQSHIAEIPKTNLVQTNAQLFGRFLKQGFLLLNTTLVLSETSPQKEAKAWQPFMQTIFTHLFQHNSRVKVLLLGNIAKSFHQLSPSFSGQILQSEHPYNHSFIRNKEILAFFKPLHLLTLN